MEIQVSSTLTDQKTNEIFMKNEHFIYVTLLRRSIIDFLLHLALFTSNLIITQIQFHIHANYVKTPTTQVTEENSKS